MHEFGLSKQLCLDFLRKQSTIANLPQGKHLLSERDVSHAVLNFDIPFILSSTEQIMLLNENIEAMYA